METKLELTNRVTDVSRLETFLKKIGEKLSLSSSMVFQLNIALEEVVSNVMLYAFPRHESHTFQLTFQLSAGQLVFTLTDDGIPFNPTEVPGIDLSVPAEERPVGGLGVFLARMLMDEVNYRREDDKNILTLIKYVN